MDRNQISVRVCNGIAIHDDSEREPNDFYATSPEAAVELLKITKLSHLIWEPACGQGHLAKVFATAGHDVLATDLIDRGYGRGGENFLECNIQFNGDIVTNPPFKYSIEFIRHALELIPDGNKVCMFLKLTFLESQKRRELFDEFPPKYVYVASNRISCGKNAQFGAKLVAYAWYIWEKGYTGDTILKWFN